MRRPRPLAEAVGATPDRAPRAASVAPEADRDPRGILIDLDFRAPKTEIPGAGAKLGGRPEQVQSGFEARPSSTAILLTPISCVVTLGGRVSIPAARALAGLITTEPELWMDEARAKRAGLPSE